MALLRSQSGPYAGMAFLVAPASFLPRIVSALFRILLLRRLQPPSPALVPFVQMWPSLGFLWPPSCSVFESRCVGTARICGRERSCQSLPRSRWASDPQHDGQGHGLRCSARPRHQTAGSCRRRFATVWWHTTGHRHDFGVHVALRWLCEAWCCSQGRCSSPSSQTQEGAHLSRADWTTRSGQIGGFSWRGWGSMV